MNKEIFYIFIALLGMLIIPFLAYAIHVLLVYLVFKKGNEWFVKSLFYIFLLRFLNPAFHPIDANSSLLFVIIIFIILIYKILKKNKVVFFKLEKQFYILIVLLFVTSVLGSLYPSLSFFRLTIWSIVVFTIFQSVRFSSHYDFLTFIIRSTIPIVWFSVLFIFITAGYRSGYYAGIANYSQAFGVIVGPLLVIYFIQLVERKLSYVPFHLLTLLLGFYEIYLTHSRTAMFSMVGALGIYYIHRNFSFRRRVSQKVIIYLMALLFGSTVVYLQNSEKINSIFVEFVFKTHDEEKLAKDVESIGQTVGEREMLIEASKQHFLLHPWTGIGFGVQIYYHRWYLYDPVLIKYIPGTDLMYSKPLEKGNVYFSILEEGGIFPGVYFFYMVLFLLFLFWKSKVPVAWVTLLTIVISFNGEAGFFAPAGIGNLQILLIAILYAIVHRKNREKLKNSMTLEQRL